MTREIFHRFLKNGDRQSSLYLEWNGHHVRIVEYRQSETAYTILPETLRLMVKYLKQAAIDKTIEKKDEMFTCWIALLTCSLMEAKKQNEQIVLPDHLDAGWKIMAIGNCPPHRCLKRSVLDRIDQVKSSAPLFKMLLT